MARVSLVELVCRVPEGWVVPNLGPVSGDPVVVRMPEVSSVVTGAVLGDAELTVLVENWEKAD